MKVLITGTSSGIGKATAEIFLQNNHSLIGLDICPSKIEHCNYLHYQCDVSKKDTLPELSGINVLVNNAGTQNSDDDIDINLKGTIHVTEKYLSPEIHSVLMVASASAHTGAEFPEYSASKGGMISYMKNVALRISKYGATCNSISPGGVVTPINKPVMEDKKLWDSIMNVTPLKRWATAEEIAEWIYFLTIKNRFCTGQDIVIDGGEKDLNSTFIWPK
ncbi:MAG: SDR family oxidoreductase [Bacteroidales bacterium]|nr:SDR family oxidoreductase [Bacteroidales bacterium]